MHHLPLNYLRKVAYNVQEVGIFSRLICLYNCKLLHMEAVCKEISN